MAISTSCLASGRFRVEGVIVDRCHSPGVRSWLPLGLATLRPGPCTHCLSTATHTLCQPATPLALLHTHSPHRCRFILALHTTSNFSQSTPPNVTTPLDLQAHSSYLHPVGACRGILLTSFLVLQVLGRRAGCVTSLSHALHNHEPTTRKINIGRAIPP